MNLFAYRKFKDPIIITAVRWYCRYGISYRDLEEMLRERNIYVDHSTLNRWVIFYAAKFASKLKKHLKEEGTLSQDCEHRSVKYLNNRIECDHGKLKRLIKPTLGFKSIETARATIEGFELMRMLKKGQFSGVSNVVEEAVVMMRCLRA